MKPRLAHLIRWAGIALLIAVLLVPLASDPSAAAGDAPAPAKPAGRIVAGDVITETAPEAETTSDTVDETPVIDQTNYPKLESQLEQLYESAVLGTGREPGTFAGQRHVDLAAGTARVILEMDVDPEARPAGPAWIETVDLGNGQTAQVEHARPIAIRPELRSAIEAAGAGYETAYQNWVQVLAPFRSLVALTEIPGVARVRLPFPARTMELPALSGPAATVLSGGAPDAGRSSSEGVSLTNAGNWHLQGYDGSGVNLAVFDFGFTGYLGLAAGGDLPAGALLVAKDYSADYAFGQEDPYGDYDHGASCAEIAHDMAPGARMYLYAFSTDAEFGNAMTDYETNAGITGRKVASMSIGWMNAGPYDGTGPIDTIVNTAATTYSIFFASAAGNNQKSHDSFTATQLSGNYVSFGGQQYNVFGPNGSNCWNIPAGYTIDLFLEWNDWQADRTGNVNGQDYDIYLYQCTSCVGGCTPVAATTGNQCTSRTVDPTEALSYTPTVARYYRLAIQRRATTCGITTTFDEWLNLHSWVNTGASNLWRHYNYCNSVSIPADADGAVAVGAVFWGEDGTSPGYGLEPFSSLGPRNASGGGNNGTTVAKIDVVAPDGTSTVTYGAADGTNYAGGGSGFWGTSGATPHVAGLAATAWQAYPGYSLAQIRSYVQGQAADRVAGACGGTAALNNTYGDGRINLPAPSTMTWTGATSTDWNTPGNWSSGSVPLNTCGTNVLIPTSPSGGRFPTLSAEAWVNNLTIQAGASLNGGSQTLHVCGNWVNSGAFSGGTGTVNFMGATTMSGGSTANDFHNVTLSPNKSLSLGAEAINVAGDWIDNGSTLVPGTSTVTFNRAGTQNVSTYALGSYAGLLAESFTSGTFPPTGWGQVDTYGTVGNWTRNTTTYHSSPASAQFTYNASNYAATRLYSTTSLNLTGYYGSRLTFYMYHDAATAGDFLQVEVSTDGGATFNDIGDPIYRYTGATGWTQHTVDLSTYDNTSSLRVAFEGVNNGGNNMYVDTIAVEGRTLAATDSTFYNLAVATGSTTVTARNVTANHDLTIHNNARLDVNAYKVLAVGGAYTYLTGYLSNSETRTVGTSAVSFYDGRGTLTAQLTRDSGSGNVAVTTRAGWLFPLNDFGTTCPLVANAVWRYYDIVPVSPASSTVRLYYLDGELNNNLEGTLRIWHCAGGSWHEQMGTLTRDAAANWVQVTGVTDFSPFILSDNEPTAVRIARFEARPLGAAIHVEWETITEIDNAGFDVYRSDTVAGEYARLNDALIPSQAPGSPDGAVYTWTDAQVQPGVTYYYRLEDVDLYGNRTPHGPVAATAAYGVYLPLVIR